jgi:hypothetical protein
MAHQLLHGPKVDTGHDEARCEGVPEIVPSEAFGPGSPQGGDEDAADEVAGVERRLAGGAGEGVGALQTARTSPE